MTITFALRIDYYDSDAPADKGKNVLLTTPHLSVFFSAEHAAAIEEGIEIEEGDLFFFSADGTPLEAHFSKKPEMNMEAKKYFAGTYSLKPTKGPAMPKVIEKIIAANPSPATKIVVDVFTDNESARQYGWQSAKAMKEGILNALKILPPDMEKRIIFE